MLLAILCSKTIGSTPVLEKTIETRTVLEDVGGIDDTKTPSFRAIVVDAVGESGVGVSWVWSEGDKRIGVCLEVGCFVLYRAHEDVRGVRKLIVIQHRMFSGGPV